MYDEQQQVAFIGNQDMACAQIVTDSTISL